MRRLMAVVLILILIFSLYSVGVLATDTVLSPEDMSGEPVGPTSPQTGMEGNLWVILCVALLLLGGLALAVRRLYLL